HPLVLLGTDRMRYAWSEWRAYPHRVTRTGDSDRITCLTCGSPGSSVLFGTRSFLDVHAFVGGLQHFVRRHAAVRPPDAEAGADPHGPPLGPDGLDDLVAQPDGEVLGVGAAEPVGEDDELVTAEPGDGVAVADAVAEPAGDLDEDGVARVVPEPVVDRLEAVEVAEQHREPLAAVVVLVGRRDRVHVVVVAVVLVGAGREVEVVAPVEDGRPAVDGVLGAEGIEGLEGLHGPGGGQRGLRALTAQPG